VRTAWALVLIFQAGCGLAEPAREPGGQAAAERRRTVAVMPFERAPEGADLSLLTATELLRTGRCQVVRVAEPARTAEDALRAATRSRADAVLAAAIVDYEPYDPPRIVLAVQFLRTGQRTLTAPEVDRLVRSHSWRRGPLSLSQDRAGNVIDVFDLVTDAGDAAVLRDLARYAAETGQDEREVLLIQPRFLKFVAYRLAMRLTGAPHRDVP